uniref:Liprin-alpha-1 n=1 Tax=Phallusia mammillata TaxID=59560 RepID=A0A6F9DPJ7_9ASCI|nr:liprin-alpha-1 [Phallusia mammillata]
MMCDIMPTISEDRISNIGADGAEEEEDKANLEQLMVTVLDERDKLAETLQESKENLASTNSKLGELEKERDFLLKQLNNTMPTDYAALTKELNQAREKLLEYTEEINDMKSERNNTRLLLEHLETLVARHERALRMTVVKRQQQQNAGVSSEVEVLKALKSLFEHHKALDEKVREKLKAALEREMHLEELLESSNRECKVLREQVNQLKLQNQSGSHESLKKNEPQKERNGSNNNITNGNREVEVEANRIVLLQETNDKQSNELNHLRQRVNSSLSRIGELEECLDTARKDLIRSEELNNRAQKESREAQKSRQELEDRLSTLERRYLNAQREAASVHELNDRLESELANREVSVQQLDERNEMLQQRIKAADLKLQQSLRRAEALPEVEAELAQRVAALTKAEERHGNVEERLKALESQLDEKSQEITRARQREKMNEEHNQRLSATVDRLLAESNERLQQHLKERMAALEEKNSLNNELDKVKKKLEEFILEKERLERNTEKLETEVSIFKSTKSSSLDRTNTSLTSHPSFGSRSGRGMPHVAGSTPDLTQHRRIFPSSSSAVPMISSDHFMDIDGNNIPHYATFSRSGDAQLRSSKARVDPFRNDTDRQNEQEWERAQQAAILSQVQQAFDGTTNSLPPSISNTTGVSEMDDSVYSAVDLLSPGQTDAQSLAYMLQDQLDAINQEISILQEEKISAERQAEEIEHRVTGTTDTRRPMFQLDSGAVVYPGGTGTPRTQPPFPTSLPSTRFNDRLLEPDESKGSLDGSGGTPSSSCGSQESVQRSTPTQAQPQPQLSKKKGVIKSSIGRLFGKKDKMRMSRHHMLNTPNASLDGSELSTGSGSNTDDRSMSCDSLDVVSSGHQREQERKMKKKHKMLEEVRRAGTPFAAWSGPTVVAWLELWVGMPAWYVAACRANVKSGAIMSALSDTEIQREIGISNALHRLKLRLAIHEMISLTSPSAPPTSRTTTGNIWMTHEEVDSLASQIALPKDGETGWAETLAYGDMNHEWIGNDWLPSLGLAQYRSHFMECLVDARMLDHLTKKDLRQHLKMVDGFHRSSLQFGILCLKRLNYNKKELEGRRDESADEVKDVLVWSNQRVIRWLQGIGLREYAHRLAESGIHGAVIALDSSFEADTLALALQIPNQNTQARQILEREFSNLIALGTDRQLEGDEGDGKGFRRSASWRKKRSRPAVVTTSPSTVAGVNADSSVVGQRLENHGGAPASVFAGSSLRPASPFRPAHHIIDTGSRRVEGGKKKHR